LGQLLKRQIQLDPRYGGQTRIDPFILKILLSVAETMTNAENHLLSVAGSDDLVSLSFEAVLQASQQIRLVVNDQDFVSHHLSAIPAIIVIPRRGSRN